MCQLFAVHELTVALTSACTPCLAKHCLSREVPAICVYLFQPSFGLGPISAERHREEAHGTFRHLEASLAGARQKQGAQR